MKIHILSFFILAILLSACANRDKKEESEPLIASVNSTSEQSYEMHPDGIANDGVSFTLNGDVIGTDGIHDGANLDAGDGKFNCRWSGTSWECDPRTPQNIDFKSSSYRDVSYFSVRYGSRRNEVSFYAAVNGKVYRSKAWIDKSTGDPGRGVAVTHVDNGINIKGSPFDEGDGTGGNPTTSSSHGTIKFNTATLQFEYQNSPTSMFSSDPPRGEKVLDK